MITAYYVSELEIFRYQILAKLLHSIWIVSGSSFSTGKKVVLNFHWKKLHSKPNAGMQKR